MAITVGGDGTIIHAAKYTGHFNSMAIAFRNPDGTIAVVVQNALETAMPFEFADPADASRGIKATLAPRSFNTFVID